MGSVFKKVLGGGGGPKGYSSPYSPQYEQGAREAISNRIGATQTLNPNYKPGSYKPGEQQYLYDYSQTGKQVTPGQANAPYDYSPIDESIAKYRQGGSTYNPYQFNYQGLPEEYAKTQYELGSKDIRRENAGQLEALKEATGTRRPGLLMKEGEASQRNLSENLASLNSNIRQKQLEKENENAILQQQNQAGENRNAAGFNADEAFRYLQGLAGTGQQKIATQAGVTQQERDYQDEAIKYLMSLFGTTTNSQNQAANVAAQREGNWLNFLGSAAGAGAKAYTACLPFGTRIETPTGTKSVQDIQVGDQVRGGKVIAINRRARSESHKFYRHSFEAGEVIMSNGHPYFDKLFSMEPVEHSSEHTYDILTDGGHYFVNGVKLGSTIAPGENRP